VFHESRGKHYSNGFGEGDTLGLMICLPNEIISLPPTHKNLVYNFFLKIYFNCTVNIILYVFGNLDINQIQKSFVLRRTVTR
jgi:hypothetical protein